MIARHSQRPSAGVEAARDDARFIGLSLTKLRRRRSLSEAHARRMMELIYARRLSAAELTEYLQLGAAKGASVEEVVGSARAVRNLQSPLHVPFAVMDTCGTGGDHSATFNISTVAALVVAAAGQPVAKHGNRSSSGGVGSADLLEALGVTTDPPLESPKESLRRHRFAFLFAPRFLPAAPWVRAARRVVRGPTWFNLIGPLCNPARPAVQVVGTFNESAARVLAEAALRLGVRRMFLPTGPGGIDELVPCGPNQVLALEAGRIRPFVLVAEDGGLSCCDAVALRGGDAATNAGIAARIIAGERGAARDAVVMNAGLALWAAGRADGLRDGCERCAAGLDRGQGHELLLALRRARGDAGGGS
ncbi:MAG: anthranilate phosphoribosyltransferase [Planctomycetes bacterium]|nr:anthranilate phosphoribosyltransferase [Planctomycetota bacterium]